MTEGTRYDDSAFTELELELILEERRRFDEEMAVLLEKGWIEEGDWSPMGEAEGVER